MDEFDKSIKSSVGAINYPKLDTVIIGIAGAGGLGSNCADNLVRSGFKRFKIVDFDNVEISNLNRQFYFLDQVGKSKVEALKENLLRINPNLIIDACTKKIVKENILSIFKECDIIVEAFDEAEDKKMLVEELLPTKKFIVAASGLCGFGRCDNIKVHKIKENLVIIGDLKTSTNCMSPISPRVNIAAAKQADVILEYVLNK